ncbi:MAG: RagB/SusD family nutrient uptake outer membrane protein [Candidatus Pedobacter colombiensis]|uniref:RagB/SusD family nutrient uptake outer membrane protein n=1 Tax=Candidatus Pedobacter colombiensis TaxID=3121371 RepID=A0AAJ5W8X3_9SPHI|nr:RagB/SusD family nutrient uptake outer membrane protein [Pedobacter sp.]WEK18582.1 MAG: RagB/SusD family nutrient uptake outer membrane protein [Pedobacter sp.]
MKLNKLIYILTIPVLMAVSCKKFLDIKPKGVIIAESLGDFEGVLNSELIVNPFGQNNLIIYSTDDLNDASLNLQGQTSPKGNTYFWVEYINNSSVRPDYWADLYNTIANLNVVTEGVLSATDGTDQQKKQLYAEAMVAKTFNYFHLLSFFAPAYNKATANIDYGLPYVNTTDVSKDTPARLTLQAMYDQLINDIVAAIPDLPETNINNTRVTKGAAYGMLARIYMSMGDYVNAEKYADLILGSGKAKIVNYGAYTTGQLPATNSSPEELWVRYSYNMTFSYSNELLSKYDLNNDLRIRLLATKKNDGTYSYSNFQAYNPNRGITYAEIFLDKAECLARSGDINGALNIVNNTIRKNRFLAAQYTALTASTPEAALTAVLEERRRELAFKGLRWIDMKRLDREGRMPAVKRMSKDGTAVLTTLAPGSSAYTFQIPLMVQSFNVNMPLNKR